MLDFSVWERNPGSGHALWPGLAWRTCLREITFAGPHDSAPAGARVFEGQAAYAHLLEVICGLDSPIVGETEVMHQFRTFTESLSDDQHQLRELGRRLLADARGIRSHHLIGLGSRSYGSAVRRYVRGCDRVGLIGTGLLAREILPFLTGDERTVDVFGRRDGFDLAHDLVVYRKLDEPIEPLPGSAALVVAAPVPSTIIARVAAAYAALARLIDLRAEAHADPPPPLAPVIALDRVFADLQSATELSVDRVAKARAEIARCARAFGTRATLHPSGWHDLCA